MQVLKLVILCAAPLLLYPASSGAEETAPSQNELREQWINNTEPKDIDFMLRFEQAVRENDKAWIAKNTDLPFGLIVNGKLRFFKSPPAITRHFDEIYPPWVKRAVMTAELEDIRSSKGLLMVFGESSPTVLITVLPYCDPEPVGCAKETYFIHSITYEASSP